MRKLSVLLWLLLVCSSAWATVGNTGYSISYTCTGGYGPFAFAFPISDPTAMTVILNGTTLSSADYTIMPVNNDYNNGGSVTLGNSYPCQSGWIQLLSRVTPITQTVQFFDNMPIPMKTFERALDKLTEIDQEIWGRTVHSIQMQNNAASYLAPATRDVTFNFANCVVSGPQDVFTITCPSTASGGAGTGGNYAGWSGTGPTSQIANAPGTFSGNSSIFPDVSTTNFPVIDVRAYGVVGDAVQVNSCTITATSFTLTCSDPYGRGFTPASVGKTIQVPLAGTSDGYGSPLVTTIAGYTSASVVTLTAAAVNTPGSAVNITYGTDNGANLCTATQCNSAVYTGIYGDGILSGRELMLPGGTILSTKPLYVRNGMKVNGAISGTQIILVGGAYKLTAPASGIFATPHVSPTICAGHNDGTGGCVSDATSNGTTGQTSIHNVLASAPYVRTPGILITGQGGEAGAFSITNPWTESYYGIVAYHTNYTTIDNFTCDTGTTICATFVGDGTDTGSSQWYGNKITNSNLGLGQVGVWVDGTKDLLISNNNFNYCFSHQESFSTACVWMYSPESYTSYRVSLLGNIFLSNAPTAGAVQYFVEFAGPGVDFNIENNTFSYSGNADVIFDNAAIGTKGLKYIGNQSSYCAQVSGSCFSAAGSATGDYTMLGNTWTNPGGYAAFSANMNAKLIANRCVNPFTVSNPASANAYDRGCWDFTGVTGITVDAVNNTVVSSGTTNCGATCPAVSFNGSSATITSYTHDNLSPYHATCDVCLFTGNSGVAASYGSETATNGGGSAAGAFIAFKTAGGATVNGTMQSTTVNATSAFQANGVAGFTGTATATHGGGTCVLTISQGIITGTAGC